MPAIKCFAGPLLAAALAFCAVVPSAIAQNQVLLPEQSEAKANQIIQLGINALGGDAYLNLRDVSCTGRVGQFDHAGDRSDLVQFNDFRQYPDKDRIEYIGKGSNSILQYIIGIDGLDFSRGGVVITLFNGEHGWSYDRGGVSDLPVETISNFHDQLNKSVYFLLRYRLKEPGMYFRYAGSDIVDLVPVDWVELVDNDNHTIRIAFARSTHLPLRKIFESRDPRTQVTTRETDVFSNFHPIQGIQTAFQTTRDRNGLPVSQSFFDKCTYDTNIPDALFTKQSLDDRWAQEGKGKDKKKDKN